MKKITLLAFVFLAFIAKGHAQFPQGFEGATFPPAGWASFIGVNGIGTAQNWKLTTDTDYISSGDQAAYVRYENVSGGTAEDWLVTPQFTVTAPNTLFAFFERKTYEDPYATEYTIRVSTTSQTDIASFTIVDTKTESDLPLMMTQRGVDLSAYVGQQIYVAFVMDQDNGDDWAIDDVDMVADVDAPDCAVITSPADAATGVAVGPNVTFTWDAPTTGDAPTSYDIWAGIALPLTAADFFGNYTTNSAQVSLPEYATTYYWTVIPKNVAGAATGCATFSFTTEAASGTACLSAPYGEYPQNEVFVSQVCDGVTEDEITGFGYAGEYSSMSVQDGLTYQFISSVTTDYITISAADGTTVYASGVSPLTWTATSDMVIRFYTHVDNQCGSEEILRSRSVICSGLTISVPDCATMTFPADGAIDVPVDTTVVFTWDAPTTGDAPDSYDFYGGDTLPLTAGDFIGNYTTTSANITITSPAYNTTFYWMIVPRNLAGEATGCASFSFTTEAAPGYCLDAYEYPDNEVIVPSQCDGVYEEVIVNDGWAGEYSSVSVIGGYTYEFRSSIATDVLSISDDGGLTAVAYGTTPVTWTATADGVVRFYDHADVNCGTNDDPRVRSVICTEALGITPFNAVGFKAYPNPVKDVLNLISEKTISKVQITNLLGQVVMEQSLNTTNGQINVADLASGTYLVKVTSDDVVKTIKVIKE